MISRVLSVGRWTYDYLGFQLVEEMKGSEVHPNNIHVQDFVIITANDATSSFFFLWKLRSDMLPFFFFFFFLTSAAQ